MEVDYKRVDMNHKIQNIPQQTIMQNQQIPRDEIHKVTELIGRSDLVHKIKGRFLRKNFDAYDIKLIYCEKNNITSISSIAF